MIDPIGSKAQSEVIARTEHYIALAGEQLGRPFEGVPIRFDLLGSSSGMFRVSGSSCEIRYNPWIFARHFEDCLAGTVPHEVAHYIVHCLYGLGRVAPHGPEWESIMLGFDADPAVTGKHDLTGIPHRRQRRWLYRCSCQDHAISTRRHNRIRQRGDRYLCRYCGSELTRAGTGPIAAS